MFNSTYNRHIQQRLETLKTPSLTSVEQLRSYGGSTAKSVLSAFPDLIHTEYKLQSTKGAHEVILSVFKEKASTSISRPAIYHVHGGGQIAGDRFTGLETFLPAFIAVDAVTISVEYRLAPENVAPAALHDSYDGLVWVAKHATVLGIDPKRLMVMGISGGGPIAAGTAMMATDLKYPPLCAQLLCTPMLDDRNITVSSQQFASRYVWNGEENQIAWRHVLGSDYGSPNVSERIAPARATDLTGLPPTFIEAGELEVFRDEAVAYASLLWKCGVSTELHVYEATFHGQMVFLPEESVSRLMAVARSSWIRRAFGIEDNVTPAEVKNTTNALASRTL